MELRRVGNNLPSRLADNFFWLGRYCERADATARLLRSLLLRLNSESGPGSLPVDRAAAQHPGQTRADCPLSLAARTPQPIPKPSRRNCWRRFLTPRRRGSLSGIAVEMQKLAMLVRDRTSNDLWRVPPAIRRCARAGRPPAARGCRDAGGVLNQTLLHLAAFHGLARENMTRAQGWRFLDIGLRLERAVYLCSLPGLRVALARKATIPACWKRCWKWRTVR